MLTRSQLLAGNSGQGTVLTGQVQGVTAGPGIAIASDGTISFDGATATGVVKLNNPSGFNGYIWPSAYIAGGQLTVDTNGNLTWIAPTPPVFGLGLNVNGTTVKVGIPIAGTPPVAGTGTAEAVDGSLYWDCQLGSLFIRYNNAWVQTNSTSSPDPINLQEQLLTGTHHLFVDSEIGSDTYVDGIYDAQAVPVVTLQQVTCGYTAQKPFRSLARAAIEVARITGQGSGFDPNFYDRIVIHVASGDVVVDNSPGSPTVTPWVSGATPTNAQLVAFNSVKGGIILPRGVSVIGEDLRKTVIRPTYIPPVTGNQDTDRTAILHTTGGSFFFNFTFKDKLGSTSSHHLVDCFQFISEVELQAYYNKAQIAFGFSVAETPANPGETEIVAPAPVVPTSPTDGVTGSSPYIFNCSVRSLLGLCGIHADGSVPTGFKSMVVAQFTGVSLQKDLRCWQLYNPGTQNWGNTFTTYTQYINAEPNNIRMDPTRLSAHIRTLNEGVIQEVSVFAIGQGVHHWAQSGSDVTVTNSNSNFGGCAALAEGYKSFAFPSDTGWVVSVIRVANNLTDKFNNIKRIYLGTVTAYTANSITVSTPLGESVVIPGQPDVVGNQDYTLRTNSYVWVDNPFGNDWRTTFTAAPWSIAAPTVFNTTGALVNQDGQAPGIAGNDAIGKRVYIRRLVDVRTPQERRFSLLMETTSPQARNPLRDYVLQTTAGAFGIQSDIPLSQTLSVNASNTLDAAGSGSARLSEIVLARQNTANPWTASNFYRTGEVVEYQNKHWRCTKQTSSATFILREWDQAYVQMADNYYPPDFFKNVTPIIIFDNDTSGFEQSVDLGYNLTTVWSTDPLIINQYRTATDYRGCQLFLIAMGFTQSQANQILTPLPLGSRDLDPAVPLYGIPAPNGAAYAWANWAVQFRRMTNIRLFGQAWEWAGYLNYTKSLPQYQKDLSAGNQFTYYFTNANGGVVYASGFNQEGYVVTPAGLLDLTTGQTISVENIGNGNLDLPTVLNNLTLTGTTTIYDNLDIQANNVTFGTGSLATTTKYGVGDIASIAELDSGLAASTDSALNAAGPNFVTPQGLEHWKIYNRLVSQRTTTLQLYVIPDWNVATQTYNSQPTLDYLLLNPPTTLAAAVPLTSAVLYANTILSVTEKVQFNLQPGVYIYGVTVSQDATVVGPTSMWDPTTGQIQYYNDPTRQALFASTITLSTYNTVGTNTSVYVRPTSISSNSISPLTVRNICWPHIDDQISNPLIYPNELFIYNNNGGVTTVGAAVRASGAVDLDSTLNYLSTLPRYTLGLNDYTPGTALYTTKGNCSVYGVLFGALSPSGSNGYGSSGVFQLGWIVTYADLMVYGIGIIGNATITPACGFPNITTTDWGNNISLWSFGLGGRGSFSWGFTRMEQVAGVFYANFSENNITLYNNARQLPAGSGVNAPGVNDNSPTLGGPYFWYVEQPAFADTSTILPSYSAPGAYPATVNPQGWVGRFANGSGLAGPSNTTGMLMLSLGQRIANLQYGSSRSYFFMAGTGLNPPYVSPGGPGLIGPYTKWDLLNVSVRSAERGMNVISGTQFDNDQVI